MKQKTLKGSFSLFGKGLHTGLNLTVTFNPAPENTGYKIQRIDLEGEPIIDAIAENVIDTQRGTVLSKGDVRVSTVEHGLSALYALGIDNCLIQVNGPEFPILDGSAIITFTLLPPSIVPPLPQTRGSGRVQRIRIPPNAHTHLSLHFIIKTLPLQYILFLRTEN